MRTPWSSPRVSGDRLRSFGFGRRTVGRERTRVPHFLALCAMCGALIAALALPPVAGGAILAMDAVQDFQELPSDIDTIAPAEASIVLAADGSRIATFYDENRVTVPLDKVAPIMKKAILSIEDARFYEHGALDVEGTLRAAVTNVTSDSLQGGSTLTQQYVKNLLIQLSDGDPNKVAAARAPTLKRKLQELKYAFEIEKRMSKDEILENYLNISYFGNGAYGVEAAARSYFSKSANDLSLTEAALIAGIVRSPSEFDPTLNPDKAKERRNVVLTRMADLGAITREQATRVEGEDLGLRLSPTRNGCHRSDVPFFCDYVAAVIQNDPIFGDTPRERSDLLRRGGLTIRTTLDPQAQKATDKALAEKTDPTDRVAAALASVEPGTGKIRAMGVSREYGSGDKGKTVVNYAVNFDYGGSRGFQNGSTNKIFTAAAAIAEGYGVDYEISSPYQTGGFDVQHDCDGKRVPPDNWSPKNYDKAYGTIPMTEGLRRSVNTYFAQLINRVGLCDTVSMAERAGLKRADGEPFHEFLPFTLGINEVSPLTVANAYATFAARGKRCDPTAIESITDRDGTSLEVPGSNCKQVIKPEIADAVTYAVHTGMLPGGFGHPMQLDSGQIAAGKTGTTNGAVAVWFAGYTPQLATAVWLGDPANSQFQMRNITIGGDYYGLVCGSCVPGPIWKIMMDGALKGRPLEDFHPADSPYVDGWKQDPADGKLKASAIFPYPGVDQKAGTAGGGDDQTG